MKILLLCALLGMVLTDSIPSSNYGPPNINGHETTSGTLINGYEAPDDNDHRNSNGATSNGYISNNGDGTSPTSININGYGDASVAISNGYSSHTSSGPGSTNGDRYIGNNGTPVYKDNNSPSNSADSTTTTLIKNIPGAGMPGEDFPILASVPQTDFSCDDQNVPGYYADTAPEAGCQVFHICQDRHNRRRQKDSFLCPNGTIFNQQYLVCDWWFNFDCTTAGGFYSVNELTGVDTSVGNGNVKGTDSNGTTRNGIKTGSNSYEYGSNGNGITRNGLTGYSTNANGNVVSGHSSNDRGVKVHNAGSNKGNGYASNGDTSGDPTNVIGYTSDDISVANSSKSPAAPSYDYKEPTAPAESYGVPTAPAESYGVPTAPAESYGAPTTPAKSYGAPL